MKLEDIQRQVGVTPDGKIGPNTIAAIAKALGMTDSVTPTDRYSECIPLILHHEGGYVNHPADPGGATNKGVTQKTYDAWRDKQGLPRQSVRNIADSEVHAIYRRDYWDAIRGDDLPAGVDYAVFDFAVNSGINRASRFLQDVVRVPSDGKIGPATIAAAKAMDPRDVVNRLCDARMAFLRGLNTFPTFGRGWTARVDEVRVKALGWAK